MGYRLRDVYLQDSDAFSCKSLKVRISKGTVWSTLWGKATRGARLLEHQNITINYTTSPTIVIGPQAHQPSLEEIRIGGRRSHSHTFPTTHNDGTGKDLTSPRSPHSQYNLPSHNNPDRARASLLLYSNKAKKSLSLPAYLELPGGNEKKNLHPPQQLFGGPPAICTLFTMASSASYADCVSSLRTSLKFLESSVETLDEGVSDFPRLVNVLKSVRVRIHRFCFSFTMASPPKAAPGRVSLSAALFSAGSSTPEGSLLVPPPPSPLPSSLVPHILTPGRLTLHNFLFPLSLSRLLT